MQWLCMQKRPRFLVSVVLVLVQTIRLELRPHWWVIQLSEKQAFTPVAYKTELSFEALSSWMVFNGWEHSAVTESCHTAYWFTPCLYTTAEKNCLFNIITLILTSLQLPEWMSHHVTWPKEQQRSLIALNMQKFFNINMNLHLSLHYCSKRDFVLLFCFVKI